jgi:hypothetical protein
MNIEQIKERFGPFSIERRTSRTENIMNVMLVPTLFLLDDEID